jgi:hypothetical protein
MARQGRPRKAGKRKYGRPIPAQTFDRGTERAQIVRAFYGTDCTDAIGRAYRAGLLGTGDEAKNLLDTGRRVANAYWRHLSTGFAIRCPLGDSNGGSVILLDQEREKRREDWLRNQLRAVETMGARRQFDQLVIDVHPDEGPVWLNRLIEYKRAGTPGRVDDVAALHRALNALAMLAGN